jgi:hypothetical protein
MTFEDVRVIHSGEPTALAYEERKQRSPARKLLDEMFDMAEEAIKDAIDATDKWLDAMDGHTDIPAKLRRLPTVLAQASEFTIDERKRKG